MLSFARQSARDTRALFPLTVKHRERAIENYCRVSCRRSARARGIEPAQELKSVLFADADSFVMAHVPGDTWVDEPKLASLVGPVTLLPRTALERSGLEKGRVNPFTAHFYLGPTVTHVVCHSVFQNETVHTNDDHVGGWIEFRPQDLLHWLPRVAVGAISRSQ